MASKKKGTTKGTTDEQTGSGEKAANDVDRVAITSLRADGTPDQTDGFEVITDTDEG